MRVESGGVGIEYEVTGDGRPVVLLHGFPDSGRLWRHQVSALADVGFKVIVPDLRGYGRSDKPAEVDAYAMQALVGDVVAVIGLECPWIQRSGLLAGNPGGELDRGREPGGGFQVAGAHRGGEPLIDTGDQFTVSPQISHGRVNLSETNFHAALASLCAIGQAAILF